MTSETHVVIKEKTGEKESDIVISRNIRNIIVAHYYWTFLMIVFSKSRFHIQYQDVTF